MRRAHAVVDVAPVGLDGDGIHARPEPAEDLGRHAVGRPVGAVEQDAAAGEVGVRKARLELAYVVAPASVQLAAAPLSARGGRTVPRLDELLDTGLGLVVQLGAVGAEELDP